MKIMVKNLPITVFSAVKSICGRVFVSNRDGVSEFADAKFIKVWKDPLDLGEFNVHRLHSDPSGAIYFVSRNRGILHRMPPGERSFHPVLNLEGVTRGFEFHAGSGLLYLGKYGQRGPAQIFTSRDGESWQVHHEWKAKHIHDLRVNSLNKRIYVAIGEGDPNRTDDSHSLYASDDGTVFRRVFQPVGRRPLIYPINFIGETVIAGTDHFEGDNYVFTINDQRHGNAEATRLFDIPHQYEGGRPLPFPYFMEWLGDHLIIGVRGRSRSFILESEDLKSWSVVCESKGRAVDFTVSTRGGSHDLIVSGVPGKIVRRVNVTEAVG